MDNTDFRITSDGDIENCNTRSDETILKIVQEFQRRLSADKIDVSYQLGRLFLGVVIKHRCDDPAGLGIRLSKAMMMDDVVINFWQLDYSEGGIGDEEYSFWDITVSMGDADMFSYAAVSQTCERLLAI